MSLAWQYSLTADELLQSQTQYVIFWKKLDQSTLNYDRIATKSYLQIIGGITYAEPQAPRIVIDRGDQATLHIKDAKKEDEGTFKIEFILELDGTVLAEQRVNLTVLGKVLSVTVFFHLVICVAQFFLKKQVPFLAKKFVYPGNSEICGLVDG